MSQTKLKPMSDSTFGLMVLTMSFEDLFRNPADKLKKAPLKQGMTVIDYACGPGRYTIPAAKMVGPTGKVYALDIQPLAVNIVKREAASQALTNIEALLIDSFNTGLPDATAEVVLLIDAITPIKDRVPLLKEIHRLLKPDGILFMDSSHMSVGQAQTIVKETGLFDLVNVDGKEMVWGKRKYLR
jgi:ubiquinone/menaquinone biosynthesis C-methylase UbiE